MRRRERRGHGNARSRWARRRYRRPRRGVQVRPTRRGDTVYQPGDEAALQLTIVNEGDRPDRLVRVTSPIARLGVIIGDTRMAGHQVLTAGYQGPLASATLPGTDAVRILLVDLRSPVRAGLRYPVVFHFEQAGELRLDLPVENPHTLRSPPAQPPP